MWKPESATLVKEEWKPKSATLVEPEATDQPPTTFWQKTKQAWDIGGRQVDLDFQWRDVKYGRMTRKQAEKNETEFNKYLKTNPLNARNWLERLYLKTVGIAHPMVSGEAKGLTYGTIGAGVGALLIPAPDPLDIATVPSGFAIGHTVGAFSYWAEQGEGSIYKEAIEANLSHKTASIVSNIGGPIYGAIEFSQVDKLIPGLGRFGKKTVLKAIVGYLKRIGVEVLEEGEQKVVTEGVTKLLGKALEDKIALADIPEEAKKIGLSAVSEMKEAIGPMTLLALPSGAIDVGRAGYTKVEQITSLDKKSQEFKEVALTKKGSEVLAAENPDIAAKIAAKETPSRNDVKELGITGWNAEERTKLASLFRDALKPETEGKTAREEEIVAEKEAEALPEPPGEEAELPAEPTKVTKEPWEMTSQEYKDFNLQALKKTRLKGEPEITQHKDKIKYAIEQGKPVPAEVLAEYKSEKWAAEALAKPAEPTKAAAERIVEEPIAIEDKAKILGSEVVDKFLAKYSNNPLEIAKGKIPLDIVDKAGNDVDLETFALSIGHIVEKVSKTWMTRGAEVGQEHLEEAIAKLDVRDYELSLETLNELESSISSMLSRLIEEKAKVLAKPAEAKEIKPYEEKAITEPAPGPQVEPGRAEKVVPTGEPTGKLDPSKYEEALEITRQHAEWVAYDKRRQVLAGIEETHYDHKTKETTTEVIYTPEQVNAAYRSVQKSIPSPMPDTDLFAMPGKEAQMQAIAQKMQKVRGVSKKVKKGRKPTKPAALPKAKTSQVDHIKAVYKVTGKETTRYAIAGVKIEGDTLVATDGRRMFWAKGKWGKDGLYLDAKSLKNGVLGKTDKKVKFPKWRDIVPDVSGEKPILVNVEGAWSDVQQAAIMTTEESKGITIIANKDGSLGFAAASPEIGHVEIHVMPGGKILGGMNPQFLLDVIGFHATRGNDSFQLYFPDWDRPMLTQSLDGKTFTLTMPINIEGVSEAVTKAIAEFPVIAEKPKKKGLKEKPKEEPAKPEEKAVEEGGGVDWSTAVRQALEKSQKQRRIVRVEQKKERGRRAAAYEGTVKWLVEKQGLSSKEAMEKATAMLKGPLTEYQLYEGLEKFLPQETIDNAYDDIRTTDIFAGPYERLSTEGAFKKLEEGAVLTLYDVRMIKKWRPELAKIAQQRVPLTVRIFSNIEQALGTLKFGAGYDVQIRRNARWLRGRHPELFTEAVYKNLDTYMIEKHAIKLEKEVENDSRYEDAVAHKVKFLKKGERPEQYISAWPEKIPFKIGKGYAASLRGYRAAHNWMQQQLWNYKIEVWERKGRTITEEMLYDLADWNNTMLGMVQAKTKFGKALRRVLAPVMWSPTLTWSRIRTPSMILTNKTMRIETAVSLASYIGSGIMYMLAASFLALALKKKDPIEWDPRSTDFGKIRVGNTRIDVYGDGGPYIRAIAQLIFQQKKNQAGRLRRRLRLDVLKQFIRNKRAPFLDFLGKVWSGKTYYGGPAWEIPDWAKIKEDEDGLKQLVARAGEKITEPKIGQIGYFITREISQKFTPFFVQSAVEASWHDGWPLGLAAGADEFFSGQALSYKPSTFAKLQIVQDISATAKYDTLWDDLSASQQKLLRITVPEINELEELLAREKLPVEEIDLREQIKVAERIRRSLPEDIKQKLAPMGYRIIPGLSRRLGDFWLNDERYAKYEELAGVQIEKRLRRLFALKSWKNYDISQQEKIVKKEINKAKAEARAKIVGSKGKL